MSILSSTYVVSVKYQFLPTEPLLATVFFSWSSRILQRIPYWTWSFSFIAFNSMSEVEFVSNSPSMDPSVEAVITWEGNVEATKLLNCGYFNVTSYTMQSYSRVMDCVVKFSPLLPENEMSYKHGFDNKVYKRETFTNRKLGIFY